MNPTDPRLSGLYVITDASLQDAARLTESVEAAVAGGARLVQYRDKTADHRLRLQQARELADLCASRDVSLIVNDDIRLAADCGAAGVHLGREDSTLETARQQLGDSAIIGISCYNRLELALEAADRGADYVAFGRFFNSKTKPDAVQADPQLIREYKKACRLPVAAIGGITPANGGKLLAAGADMLAVVRAVFGADEIRRAALEFANLFETPAEQDTLYSDASGTRHVKV